MLLAHERGLEARIAQLIAQLGRQVAQAHRYGESTDAAVAAYTRGLQQAMRASLTAAALDYAHRLMTSPKAAHAWETKAFEDLDAAIARHMAEHTAEAVVGISESTRATIARVVAEGVAENLGQEEIAARIVEATSGDIAMARARRIARTEVHFAAMYGQQQAAEASPLAFEKEWLATEDARTRKQHAEAHGQRVPLAHSFIVGDTLLRYPGDTAGPPGEIINCRCVCLYNPLPYPKGQEPQPTPAEPVPPPVEVRPEPEIEDVTPEGDTGPELVTERDLEARPYEREAVTIYAAGALLSLDDDSTPRVGEVRHLVGPADLFFTPDAPEVDRQIASNPGGLFTRRPVLWQITIPGGPWLPEKLVEMAAGGWVINSGVGRFGLVPLTVRKVRKVRWSEVAAKPLIDPGRFAPAMREFIEMALARVDDPDWKPADVANTIGIQLIGWRDLEDESGVPESVLRTLRDTPWSRRSLRTYLERLLAGEVQDMPGPDEPDTEARVIVVEAEADILAAVPAGYQDETQ